MKALKSFEDEFSQRVQELCEVIKERSAQTGTPLDFSEHLRYATPADDFGHST